MKLLHRLGLAIVLAGLLAMLFPVWGAVADDTVTFPDPNLEAATREAIGKPDGDIYQSDLVGLTSFSAAGRGIVDLTGIEHCTSLTSLDLGHNDITDVSALSGLTSLSSLDLSHNDIADVSVLSGLTSLTRLDLSGNQISDIYHLVGNTGLGAGDSLNVSRNPLNCTSLHVCVPQLQQRGVGIYYDMTSPAYDVNCDTCTDVLDIISVGQQFGQTGASRWVGEDVNGDGAVSVLDIVLIGQHFGEGCPAPTPTPTPPQPTPSHPALKLSRYTGAPGTSVRIYGSGFVGNDTAVTVTWDGSPVAEHIAASPGGTWTTNFTVPPSSAGAHLVSAYGSKTPSATVPVLSFTVTGRISLSQSSGAPGSLVTISGSGFGAGETGITVTWDGTPVVTGIAADSQGAWSTIFSIPASALGSHTVAAYGSVTPAESTPAVTFTVTAGTVSVALVAPLVVNPGSDFVARVSIANVPDLNSYQFDVSYDPAVIQVVGAEGGLEGIAGGNISGAALPVDMWGYIPPGTPGKVRILGHIPGVRCVSGSGYVVDIHFHVAGALGTQSALSFSNGMMFSCQGDPVVVPVDWEDGAITVENAPQPQP